LTGQGLKRALHFLGLILSAGAGAAEHWAFQPLNPGGHASIDAFIDEKIGEHSLQPAPRADPRALWRRVAYRLTGLPPDPNAPDLAGSAEQAYEVFVDRMLASPHFGEHWARLWLDVARYSDTKGYVYAREEKKWVHAAAYRDWVTRAFNEDMPYDRFLLLQIAADQLVPPKSPDLAAMGFLTLGRRFLGVTHDIIDDRIDVVTRGILALTVTCARCHDHKFDPVPAVDYYALYGVFQSSAEVLAPCGEGECAELAEQMEKHRELMTLRREEQMARTRSRAADYLVALNELENYPEQAFGQRLDENDLNPYIVHRWKEWLEKNPGVEITDERLRQRDSPAFVPDEHIANIEMFFPSLVTTELWKSQQAVDHILLTSKTAPPYATILADREEPVTVRVFLRGNPLTRGDEAPRRFLSLLGDQRPFTEGSGRLELARAIADPRNPLTARVMVNRVWQHLFGRGLVATPGDFGRQSSPPSHPQLLDWLAAGFIRSGWSVKRLVRLIVLSETFRRESKGHFPSPQDSDPDNILLARHSAHRLSFEEMRDSWLAAAGRLDRTMGGSPGGLLDPANNRRTLYAFVDREKLPAVMSHFDFANPDLSIPRRTETQVPQQALFSLNHPYVLDLAQTLAASAKGSDTERVRFLYGRLFQRDATHAEMTSALAFVNAAGASAPAWEQLAQVLLLSNEFMFVD
jgi:hypothetical protein